MSESLQGLIGATLALVTFSVVGFMAGIYYQKRHQPAPTITDSAGNVYTFVEGVFRANDGNPISNSAEVRISLTASQRN